MTEGAPPIPIAKPLIGREEQEAVRDVLASGHLASGPVVSRFEKAFAEHVGVKHCIFVSSGTTALHAALLAMDIGPGDEVAVPAFTFVATANVVLYTGAKPLLVDVEPGSLTMDPAALERQITEETRAVIPVHLYGCPADMPRIQEIAAKAGASVLGDACQAHGASLGRTKVGAMGEAECFSFYPTKNLTTGEGGAVTTNDDELAARIRSIINHGRGELALGTYDHVRLGHNFRSTDVAAAIGLVQLARLDGFNERRIAIAARYTEAFRRVAGLVTQEVPLGARHVYHQYTIRLKERQPLLDRLKEQRIGYGIYYPKALHQFPHLSKFGHSRLSVSEEAAKEVVSLPVHPGLSDADVERVISAVTR